MNWDALSDVGLLMQWVVWALQKMWFQGFKR